MVSVIMATYRQDKLLHSAIESIFEQTMQDYEIILVDDNADAEWNERVHSIVDSFDSIRIKYICNEHNKGSAISRNIGISVANGEYITFLDDDDVYLPQRIEVQLERMISNNADFSIMDLSLFDEEGAFVRNRTRHFLLTDSSSSLICQHMLYHLTGTDTMMFRREYLSKIGGFDPIDFGDEFYLMTKAIVHGGSFVYVPIIGVKALLHKGNSGLSKSINRINGEKELFEFKKKYFSYLTRSDRRYVKMRHYAVQAYVYYSNRCIWNAVEHLFLSFFSSPIGLVKLFAMRERKEL